MAWPPGALPINRTNATPQEDDHPDLHNATSAAVNDTVGQLLASRRVVAAGSAGLTNTATAVGNARLVRAVVLAGVAVPTEVYVTAAVLLGADGGIAEGSAYVRNVAAGADLQKLGPVASSKANSFVNLPATAAYAVAAGVAGGFELYVDIVSSQGTPYVQAALVWYQLAATGQ